MRLKRIYHQDKLDRDKTSGRVLEIKPGALQGVRLIRAVSGVHHFADEFILKAIAEGWMQLAGDRLTISPLDAAPVVYRRVRLPGLYCCHCDAPLEGNAVDCLAHVRAEHGDAPSPDPNNPAGYRRDNFGAWVNEAQTRSEATPEELAEVERMIREGRWAKLGPKHRAKSLRISGGADFVFNIAKGSSSLYYQNVDGNNPANSALIILVLAAAGIETDAVLKDVDTVSALVAGTTNEVTNTNYARKTLTDADLTAFAPDDTNDRVDLDIPDQTWTAVAAGDGWSDFVVAYDNDTAAGTDANVTPLTLHDFVVTPDGSNITAQIAAAGFFRAS